MYVCPWILCWSVCELLHVWYYLVGIEIFGLFCASFILSDIEWHINMFLIPQWVWSRLLVGMGCEPSLIYSLNDLDWSLWALTGWPHKIAIYYVGRRGGIFTCNVFVDILNTFLIPWWLWSVFLVGMRYENLIILFIEWYWLIIVSALWLASWDWYIFCRT